MDHLGRKDLRFRAEAVPLPMARWCTSCFLISCARALAFGLLLFLRRSRIDHRRVEHLAGLVHHRDLAAVCGRPGSSPSVTLPLTGGCMRSGRRLRAKLWMACSFAMSVSAAAQFAFHAWAPAAGHSCRRRRPLHKLHRAGCPALTTPRRMHCQRFVTIHVTAPPSELPRVRRG